MISYITTKEHEHKLDNIVTSLNMVLIIDVIAKQSLNDYIVKNLKNMTSLTHIIIHQDAIMEDEEELNEIVEALNVMYGASILLMKDDRSNTANVIKKDKYTVINTSNKDASEEISLFLSNKLEYKQENIWIGVAGASNGCGTTSVAIKLANYIKQYDNSVCYVEANQSDHLEEIADYYLFDKLDEGHFKYQDLTYRKDKIDTTVHFLIFDLGNLSKSKMSIYEKCTIKLLVSDSKPYRLKNTDMILNGLITLGKINMVLTFAPEDERERIRNKYIDMPEVNVIYAPNNNNLFSVSSEYKELMQEYINITDNDTFKKTKPVKKIKTIKKGMLASLVGVIVSGSIMFNVFFIKMYGKESAEKDIIVLNEPIKIVRDIDKLEDAIAATEATESIDETEMTTEIANNTSNAVYDDVQTNTHTTTESAKQANAGGVTVASSTETTAATTEASVPQVTTTEARIEAPTTISLSGYSGQIYSGGNVRAIINKVSGYGVGYSILLRDNTSTSDTSMIDGNCSYLCQVNGNSICFVEQ